MWFATYIYVLAECEYVNIQGHDPYQKGGERCRLSVALNSTGAQGVLQNPFTRPQHMLCDERRTYLTIPITIIC